MASSFADLLHAIASKDESAFAELYMRAAPKLLGITLQVCGDRASAEDALQDAFVDIWNRAAHYDPVRGKAEHWIAVVARNRAIDLIRRRGRQARPIDQSLVETLLSGGAEPASDADRAQYLALMQCLERLKPTQRKAVLLAYYKGLSRKELADLLGEPENTVKSWLRRSLMALKGCLDE